MEHGQSSFVPGLSFVAGRNCITFLFIPVPVPREQTDVISGESQPDSDIVGSAVVDDHHVTLPAGIGKLTNH